ncbi:MAG: 7TM-DISM domain-containing protein, partial [Thiovulaceae bacterium]|nr:7TM-DISM domain-containing protein [Sulfurimonadaceae bacterium]
MKTFSQVSFYEDTTKKMGIEEIKKQNFKVDHTMHSSQGASNSAWWIKFEVQNPTNKPIDWILYFNYSQFDEMQSWQYSDKNLLISHSLKGDHHIDESKISLAQRTSFEFVTPANEKNTVYIKLAYVGSGV